MGMSKRAVTAVLVGALVVVLLLLLGVGALMGSLTLFHSAAEQKRRHDASSQLDLGAMCGVAAISSDGRFANPLVGKISSPFGPRPNPFGPGVLPPGFTSEEHLIFHYGVDIAGVPEGTPFHAAASGVVIEIGDSANGNPIKIDSGGGYIWTYLHAADGTTVVKVGQQVSAGDPLAGVGQTGAAKGVHLHLQLRANGEIIDPAPYLAEHGVTVGQGASAPAQSAQKVSAASGAATSAPPSSTPPKPKGPISVPLPEGTTYTLSPAQQNNAAVIIGTGRSLGVSDQAVLISLMTVLQETALWNLASPAVPESLQYPHDREGVNKASVGLFQQQHTMGWGPVQSLMQPEFATRSFYGGPMKPAGVTARGLLDYPGWETMAPGDAAQMVQMSGHPDLYHQWENTAKSIMLQIDGATVSACHTAPAAGGGTKELTDQAERSGEGTQTVQIPAGATRDKLVADARSGIGGAYKWGGSDFKAWDASGLVTWVYRAQGIQIPRTDQWTVGKRTETPKPGDIVAQKWDADRNRWEHVGIYVGDGRMISAINETTGTREHPVAQLGEPTYFDIMESNR